MNTYTFDSLTTDQAKAKFLTTAARLANLFLLGAGVACFLALSYFVYYYVWTGERRFTSAAGIVLYIFSPGLLGTAFFVSLRFRPSYRFLLVSFCLSFIVSIYGTELLLRAYHKFVLHFDTRTRSEVIMDLRYRGVDAVPSTFGPLLLKKQDDGTLRSVVSINGAEVLPLAGISQKVTVMCNESGQYLIYKSDAHGFHNPEDIWKFRDISIAAVGDSFTLGLCVPSDKNFVALIRKSYPTTLNLGMNGAGPLVELAAVKEYLPLLRPKVVLWFYFEANDQSNLNAERRNPLLTRYLEDGFNQALIARQNEIDQALTKYIDNKRRFAEKRGAGKYLRRGLKIIQLATLRHRLGLVYGESAENASLGLGEVHMKLFSEILQNAQALIKSWNGTLYFVYLPHWRRYATPQLVSYPREPVLALVRSLEIPTIDIHDPFLAHGDPQSNFPYRQNGHYNEQGHRLVAETVLNVISHRHPRDFHNDGSNETGDVLYHPSSPLAGSH